MNRRDVLIASVAAGGSLLAARSGAATLAVRPDAELRLWDNHTGFGYEGPQDVSLLDHWRSAGVHYVCVNVGFDMAPWSSTFLAIADYTKAIAARSDMRLCATLADVQDAWRAGRMAVTFNIEGMGALNETLSLVELYYRLGVRQMLIAYNANNAAGGGCHDEDRGLTDFGRAVIREMNRVGMVVDCAHSGIRSGLEAMRLSDKPCIFSHANVRALYDHERNITDEQIKAVAATGGVVGINGIGIFLGPNDTRSETFARHIDYVVQLVGPDHAGLGLDYVFDQEELLEYQRKNPHLFPQSEGYTLGPGLVPPEQLADITECLIRKGYATRDIRKILGGNFMRVARESWK